MPESPRIRRLRSDLAALTQLAADSTIFDFTAYGSPPDFYVFRFRGRGVWLPEAAQAVTARDQHEVHVRLGASYPRMMPELAWKTPIFHPNVSTSGVVCLGGYGTYWVPSLALADLCGMLWDMVRYQNFDEKSPYNREAAAWAKSQSSWPLPIDDRPIRDKLVKQSATAAFHNPPPLAVRSAFASPQPAAHFRPVPVGEIVEAELVTATAFAEPDILFIE
jgi:ubiquitin-protein ligase